ncbi:hypothetical protein QZH41_000320 [Actinostola sp. cb2023]|nr:hypothetical protein QZH41_000320 [Actinostola sp. cb2023]
MKPPWMRTTANLKVFASIVDKLKSFAKYPQIVRQELSKIVFYECFENGRVIVRQGDVGFSFYFILSGGVTAEVSEKDEKTGRVITQDVAEMFAGDMFGEVSLLHNIQRTATIICKGKSEFLRIDKPDFDMTGKTIMISSVWVYSIVVASTGLVSWTYPDLPVVQISNGCFKPDPYFYTFVAIAGFFLPLMVIIFAYSYVFKISFGHWRAIRRLTVPVIEYVPHHNPQSNQRRALTREIKAAKTLAIVLHEHAREQWQYQSEHEREDHEEHQEAVEHNNENFQQSISDGNRKIQEGDENFHETFETNREKGTPVNTFTKRNGVKKKPAGSLSTDSPTSGTQLSGEIVAAIQQAVDNAFAASAKVQMPPPSWPTSTSIVSQANSLLSAGTSTVPSQLGAVGGKSPVVVPSFMNTFSASANVLPALPAMLNASPNVTGSLSTSNISAMPSMSSIMPTLYQPFVVGPGYSPIPAKLVGQIVTGKFIDLSDLLPSNLTPVGDSEPQLMLDGRLVLTSAPKKPKRRLEDIVSWTEAFSVFSLVMTTYFPQRWRDILLYKLLIIRTYRLFSGRAWLAYDQAFREHAAAAQVVDWSQINVQLYNFHTAGSSPRSSSSSTVCISWNRGHCSSPYSPCRFIHRCLKCSGSHKELDCSERQSSAKQRGRSASPGVSRGKYRKH